MVAWVEGFILDGGDFSLACALIQLAETPERGTESHSGFSWTPHSSALLFSPSSCSVSVYFKQTGLILIDESHHRDAIIEFGLIIKQAKYRLFGGLLCLFACSQNLNQCGIRLRGTCFVSDALSTGHMMAVFARTGKVKRFSASLLSLLILISI